MEARTIILVTQSQVTVYTTTEMLAMAVEAYTEVTNKVVVKTATGCSVADAGVKTTLEDTRGMVGRLPVSVSRNQRRL